MMKRAHTCEYKQHPSREWRTHMVCIHCGFALARIHARIAIQAGAHVHADAAQPE